MSSRMKQFRLCTRSAVSMGGSVQAPKLRKVALGAGSASAPVVGPTLLATAAIAAVMPFPQAIRGDFAPSAATSTEGDLLTHLDWYIELVDLGVTAETLSLANVEPASITLIRAAIASSNARPAVKAAKRTAEEATAALGALEASIASGTIDRSNPTYIAAERAAKDRTADLRLAREALLDDALSPLPDGVADDLRTVLDNAELPAAWRLIPLTEPERAGVLNAKRVVMLAGNDSLNAAEEHLLVDIEGHPMRRVGEQRLALVLPAIEAALAVEFLN